MKKIKLAFIPVMLCLMIVTIWQGNVMASTSDYLDPTFGDSGVVVETHINPITYDIIGDLVIRPDQRIVTVGGTWWGQNAGLVMRYMWDGEKDTSFNTDNAPYVIVDFDPSGEVAKKIMNVSNDRTIVAGLVSTDTVSSDGSERIEYNIFLTQYHYTGIVDHEFGINGVVHTPIDGITSKVYGLALQDDNKIVVAGMTKGIDLGSEYIITTYRLHPDGTLDTSFGENGEVSTEIYNVDHLVQDIAIQPDGKILILVNMTFLEERRTAVIRYNPDGSLDETFYYTGKAVHTLGMVAHQMELRPDGKIVLSGEKYGGKRTQPNPRSIYHFAVAQLNSDGSLDSSFGDEGVGIRNLGDMDADADAMVLLENGQTFVTGSAYFHPEYGTVMASVLFNEDGSVDETFGDQGLVILDFTGHGHAAVLQEDGKIVVAGYSYEEQKDMTLVRYLDPTQSVQTDGSTPLAINNQNINVFRDHRVHLISMALLLGASVFVVVKLVVTAKDRNV